MASSFRLENVYPETESQMERSANGSLGPISEMANGKIARCTLCLAC